MESNWASKRKMQIWILMSCWRKPRFAPFVFFLSNLALMYWLSFIRIVAFSCWTQSTRIVVVIHCVSSIIISRTLVVITLNCPLWASALLCILGAYKQRHVPINDSLLCAPSHQSARLFIFTHVPSFPPPQSSFMHICCVEVLFTLPFSWFRHSFATFHCLCFPFPKTYLFWHGTWVDLYLSHIHVICALYPSRYRPARYNLECFIMYDRQILWKVERRTSTRNLFHLQLHIVRTTVFESGPVFRLRSLGAN